MRENHSNRHQNCGKIFGGLWTVQVSLCKDVPSKLILCYWLIYFKFSNLCQYLYIPRYGSTNVRVGSSIFGARNYPNKDTTSQVTEAMKSATIS